MLIYTGSGLWKLFNPARRDGSALHYILNSNVFHRFPQGLPEVFEAEATLEIGLFSYVMLASYIAFIDPFRFAAFTQKWLEPGRPSLIGQSPRISTSVET